MKVLVRFKGDNDFGQVLLAFGNLLLKKLNLLDEGEAPSPEFVARWFNELAPTIYEMVQCRDYERLGKTRAYLQIKPKDVYVGEAVEERMKTAHEWANYDSVMVDNGEHSREKVYLV